MQKLVIVNILRIIALLILQILLLSYVYLGGYVIPIIYVLAVLMLPTGMNKVYLLLIAFAMGFAVDIFCNVPGLHAFSCTMMAFARELFGNRILKGIDPEEIEEPSILTVPFQQYAGYIFLMVFVFCFSYFMVEAFSFHQFWQTLLAMLASTAATWVVCMLSQFLFTRKK